MDPVAFYAAAVASASLAWQATSWYKGAPTKVSLTATRELIREEGKYVLVVRIKVVNESAHQVNIEGVNVIPAVIMEVVNIPPKIDARSSETILVRLPEPDADQVRRWLEAVPGAGGEDTFEMLKRVFEGRPHTALVHDATGHDYRARVVDRVQDT